MLAFGAADAYDSGSPFRYRLENRINRDFIKVVSALTLSRALRE
jgi:hypothetical protein